MPCGRRGSPPWRPWRGELRRVIIGMMVSQRRLTSAVCLGAFALAVTGLHLPDLELPYFWDEAGYFIPAALDLFASGDPIPSSVQPNAHPPLIMAVLSLVWWVCGVSIAASRLTMLAWAATACWGAYELGRRAGGDRAAWMSAALFALYPVFFAQSALVQLDLPAASLTLWAVVFFNDRRSLAACIAFSLAVLAKESAVVCAVALAAAEIVWPSTRRDWWRIGALLVPAALLAGWLAYVHARTGYAMGNPEFARYNLGLGVLTPSRLLAAAALRVWHSTGHMFLFALTLPVAALVAGSRPARRRLTAPEGRLLRLLGLCVAAYVAAFSIAGGAVLARYMLTATVFVIVICASVLATVPWGRWITVLSMGAFGAGLLISPPYHCAYDDTLLYRSFIALHRQAAAFLEAAGEPVITTWPASDELSNPALGYVSRPVRVIVTPDLSADSLKKARSLCGACAILLFPTQYEPEDSWLRPGRILRKLSFWRRAQHQFETRPSPLLPRELAKALNGRVVWESRDGRQYAAVVR
jgi:4-amino-4-deoxy-L-arabinose transferase-like glycosyltransferase